MYAVIGKTEILKNHESRCSIQKVISNGRNVNSFQNDLAIIIIKCNYPNDKSIGLYSQDSLNNHDCLIFGYGGSTSSHELYENNSNTLHYGKVEQISQEECEKTVGRAVAPMPNNGQVCARGLVDACPGK